MQYSALDANGSAEPHDGSFENLALATLSPPARQSIERHLRTHQLREGAVLWDAGEAISRVYFPHSGLISITIPTKDGHAIEVASIGPEGAAGIQHQISANHTRAVVQVAGAMASISAEQLLDCAAADEEINRLTALCQDWSMLQAQQIAACNSVHAADARLCRWLWLTAQRLNADLIPTTQETLGHILGIRRTTVTLIAQGLQAAGLIRYTRGRIHVLDRDALLAKACDCCNSLGRESWPGSRIERQSPIPAATDGAAADQVAATS